MGRCVTDINYQDKSENLKIFRIRKLGKVAAHMSLRACDNSSVFQKIKPEGVSPHWFCEADI